MPSGGERGVAGAAVLDKAMDLLDLVAAAAPSAGFAELQQRSALPRSTLHRLLTALEGRGLLRRDATDRSWRLGYRLLELAHGVWSELDLRAAAAPELALLRDTTDETVQFGVLDGDACVIGDAAEGRQAIRLAADIGQRSAWWNSPLGCAIGAYLEPVAMRALLDPLTPAKRAPLEHALELARGRGYFVQGADAAGTSAVAAPLFDYRGVAVAAIGVVGPAFRLPPERLHALAPPLMEAARRLSHNAGGTTMSLAPAVPEGRPTSGVHCVVDARALLGEAPYWNEREHALVWVDMLAPALHRFVLAAGRGTDTHQVLPLSRLTSVAIPRRAGGYLLAQPSGLRLFDPAHGLDEPFAHPEGKRAGNRYNDGKCDARGRLWIGTMDPGGQPGRGSLLRVDADGTTARIDTGFTVANGIGFAPDGSTLYFAESAGRTVFAYDLDAKRGTVSRRRTFASWPDGVKPDGLAVDVEGGVWVAIWDGWRIERWTADGKLQRTIRLPVPRPTSVAFGGRDLATLYITTARLRLATEALLQAPLSGGVFACAPGMRGMPVGLFAG
ncbi:MAG: SMP-30/gluconolactonase/LRE family protein [Betaproteobacteria bacterium]